MSLLVIEGLDGSGKGTQTRLLSETIREHFGKVRQITFPDYDSPACALVKMYLAGDFGKEPGDVNAFAASTFYAVDRFASFRRDWGEDYRQGTPILADRYTTANMIYQLGKLPREEWEEYLKWAEDFEYNKLGLPRPDCVIYLDMPVDISQKLLSKRYEGDEGKKDIHESHVDFLKKSREAAAFAAQRLGWQVVSCAEGGEPLPVEDIRRKVWELANSALKK